MATLNLGRVRGDKGADSTVPGPRGIPGPQGPQGPAGIPGPKGEDATPIDLGSAATKDVGTGTEQIPQNKNLGSAAFRNIGTSNGQLVERIDGSVGGTGIGGNSRVVAGSAYNNVKAMIGQVIDYGTCAFRIFEAYNEAVPTFAAALLIRGGDRNGCYGVISIHHVTGEMRVTGGYSYDDANQHPTVTKVFSTANTYPDANGYLRTNDNGNNAVVTDTTGNISVSSIQAGAGAPKVKHAFFNSTNVAGPGSIASVALGIPYNKILAISCLLGKTTTKYPPNHSDFADKALYYVKLVRVASDMAAVQFILATGDQSSSLYYATTQIFVTYTE